MKYRNIGTTDIQVSEISLGCWTMGGLTWKDGMSVGWANVDESEISEAVNYAIENGVTHFDNADLYGNGRSERMLAKILGDRTDNYIISTKVGWFSGTAAHAYEPLHIRHQCEQSLKNLNREYIDIYYFHHGDFGKGDMYLDDAIEVMYKLKEEGKIRAIGQSAYSNSDFEKLVPKVNPDVLQSRANAIDDNFISDNSPVRNLLEKNNISFVAFGPLAQGLLLDKYKKENPPKFESGDNRGNGDKFKTPYLAMVEPKINRLKEKFGDKSKNLVRVALQYLLHYNVVCAVIPGFRNLQQVKTNLQAENKPLTNDEFEFVKSVFRD